jgi:hypothetical protein
MSRKHISRASKNTKPKEGFTRREFLTDCAIPTVTAFAASPILEGLVRSQTAHAESALGNVAVAHFHLSGGYGASGVGVARTADGNIISRETMRLHGVANGLPDPVAAGTLVTTMGAYLYPANISSFTAGLLNAITPATQSRVAIVMSHARSSDDSTSTCAAGVRTLLTKLGMSGAIADAAGTVNSSSGNGTQALIEDPSASVLTVRNFADLANSVAFSRVLTNHSQPMLERIANAIRDLSGEKAARLGSKAEDFKGGASAAVQDFLGRVNPTNGVDSLNPTSDQAIASVYGLDAASSANLLNNNDANVTQASIVKASLDRNVGPVAFQISGYDYHVRNDGTAGGAGTYGFQTTPTLNTSNGKDQIAGQTVGRYLQAAAAKGRNCVVLLSTDGAVSANLNYNPAVANDTRWQGDREAYSALYSFWYFASARPTQQVTNVGNVDGTAGTLNRNAITGDLRMAVAHIFYNIAVMYGQVADAEAILAQATYSSVEIAAIRGMPKIFA